MRRRRTHEAVRVLAVTSEWATPAHPAGGAFVARQIEWVRRAGVDVDVEAFSGARNPLNYLAVRQRVHKRLRTGRYNVVHAHFGQAGVAAGRVPAPLVVSFYGSDLEGILGPRGRYTLRGKVLARLGRRIARRADAVIVVAESLARLLPRDVRYTVVPTAVDLEVFRPGSRDDARRALGLPLDRKVVLFAGRPEVPVKRFELARRVVELVGSDAELLTISDLAPSGVAAYMQASDVLLLTSLHEGAPTVVKEAIACRLPVVSVDVGDVRTTLGDLPGSVVDTDAPPALADAITTVLAQPRSLDRAIPDGLDQAVQSARVVEIYEGLLRRGSAS